MPWSKRVLSKDFADKSVLDFKPPRFDLGTPDQALDYLKEKSSGSDFRMSDAVRIQTGINKIEEERLEGKIEEAALEKLKEIQESAYKQAYELGLEEGRNDAFGKVSAQINLQMEALDMLLTSVTNLKSELAHHNEAFLVKLVFQLATRIAKVEITTQTESIIQVLKDAVSLSQEDENITVRVSQDQFDFLETLKKQNNRELEFMKKIRFESSAEVTPGGCIVETNYGEIDATLEQRVNQIWQALSESIPKIKNKIAS